MTTATPTKTKTIWVELYLPVKLELEVENTDTETILNSIWNDLKDTDSINDWVPDYSDMKEVVRSIDEIECISEEDNWYSAN